MTYIELSAANAVASTKAHINAAANALRAADMLDKDDIRLILSVLSNRIEKGSVIGDHEADRICELMDILNDEV
jgi:hypothetical protein